MKAQKKSSAIVTSLLENLIDLIEKGNAHASLDNALTSIPFSLLGEKPGNLPYSIWQVVEHIRIAQWDILEFSRTEKHVSPKWPEGYWPKKAKPDTENEWRKSLAQIQDDRQAFIELIKNGGDRLDKPFEYGEGQSLLKEALVLADHNSYHTGEIIIIRRLLNIWNS